MNCNIYIHDDLKSMNELMCPFCDEILMERKKVVDEILMERKKVIVQCCDEQDLRIVDGMNLCFHCGLVCFCNYVSKYVDFHTQKYKIRRKSRYDRKYHIENVLNDIYFDNRVELTRNQMDRIYKVFKVIGNIHHLINQNRRRMINIKFIILKLFAILRLSQNDIKTMKSKSILEEYEKYWKDVQTMVGDEIIQFWVCDIFHYIF